MKARALTLLEAMDHPELFAPWFKNPKDWIAWRAFIAALFGLKLDSTQQAIFRQHTQRTVTPRKPVHAGWLVIGRRGGKSFVLALIAVFISCFSDYRKYLAPGERATVMIIAADRKQARIIFRYCRGLLHGVAMLKAMIQRETQDTFDLVNFVTIEVATASSKRTRGYACPVILVDEIAHFETDDDAADPDVVILEALRPSQAQFPNSMILCASSPYARRGAMWETYSKHFGKNDPDLLIWQADTCAMNPTREVKAFVARKYEDDPVSAAAEYGAEFRTDIAAFVSREVVEAATIPGRHELPSLGAQYYVGFADASGGSGGDSFTAAVAHRDPRTKQVVIDAFRERTPPFSPEETIGELARFFKTYRIRRITADRWGGQFPVEQFAKFGIACEPCELPKSDLYKEFLPLLNSGRVELLDHPKLFKQLCGLERRTARGGRDSIDHPPRGHDDIVNAIAGAAYLVGNKPALVISAETLARSRMPAQPRTSYSGGRIPCFFGSKEE